MDIYYNTTTTNKNKTKNNNNNNINNSLHNLKKMQYCHARYIDAVIYTIYKATSPLIERESL